ncbi:MAG TPA: DJ-1/PfpI family protein [Burkholderiales bacterium]|nr:DJ-1/PfpI family protein [Burkholderiales bacterium]
MKAAFIVFDNMTALDFIGFYDPMTRLKTMKILEEFEWKICAYSTQMNAQITDDRGLKIAADSLGGSLAGYDLLFIPGGFGTRPLQHDRAFVDWIGTAQHVPLKTSVCTGSLLLGAAGFLKGKRATTHPSAYQELEPYCATVVKQRIVDEGNLITGGGVSTSIDLGLHVVQRLAGADARARIAKQMDYPYS